MPPKVLTNADLEQMVETTDEWILQRTGIRERHIADRGVGTSDLAYEASKKAIERAGLTPADIDLIIVGTTTPDMPFPSTACLLQAKTRRDRDAWGFDLVRGVLRLHVLADDGGADGRRRRQQACARGRRRRDVEHHRLHRSHHLRPVRRRRRCGRGRRRPTTTSVGLIDFENYVDGSGGHALCMPAGGSQRPASHETVEQRLHYVKQEGQTVFKFAVRNMEEVCRRILERNNIDPARLDLFVAHQANRRIIQSDRREARACRPKRSSSTSTATATPRRHDSAGR